LACAPLASLAEEPTETVNSEYVLQRVPPKSPAEALASFEIADGFRIELVAAEPLVVDPVAMAFDEHGRLYVVEMRDYSEQDKARLGRVRLLTDVDGDGKFDASSVYVEGLSWPTAVACYNGGVFVGAAPDILYCKDHDGDGTADENRAVFTGFGRSNVQGLINSFQWGLDHRIYGATSSTGGRIIQPGLKRPAIELSGRDFAFDPKTRDIVATTGGGQHGLCFNRWGDRFVCSNSDHLQAIVFEERYLARNPFQLVSSARRSIAADGPQAAVYRISPVEEWRVARTKLRVAGLAPGPIEGGGQPAGYFTSATGVTVYDGGLWESAVDEKSSSRVQKNDRYSTTPLPHSCTSWVYIADVGSNLIHRKRLVRDGVTYRGERVDHETEFVRSRDIWFRPVQMAIGPEGALYVADMYREVIEHPASLPPELKAQLDLTSGNDRGRIYRIVPANFIQPAITSLADRPTSDLIAALDDGNPWRRITALRLLYERQDQSAADLLRAALSTSKRPEGRIAILYALESLNTLKPDDVNVALRDPHAEVRRHALRLAEPLLDSSEEVRSCVFSMVEDMEPVVQFQLALTLGEGSDPKVAELLTRILTRNVEQQDIVDAALTSLHSYAGDVLRLLLADDECLTKPAAKLVLRALVRQLLRQRREADLGILNVALLVNFGRQGALGRVVILQELAKLPVTGSNDDSPVMVHLRESQREAVATLVRQARDVLEGNRAPLEQRLTAIECLSLDAFENQRGLFAALLSPQEPAAIHAAVLAACAEFDTAEVATLVLASWEQLGPSERAAATDLLLRREAWALELLRHMRDSDMPLATLGPSQLAKLENFPAASVRQMATELRGQDISADRRAVFDDYREVLLKDGDPARGKSVFTQNCATCHDAAPGGNALGPNLAAMLSRGTEATLFNVLVPNAEVDPRYLEYMLVTVDGQVITGIVEGQSSTSVTLRGPDNKTASVLRAEIEELRNTGKSLMPEGFEKTIDKAAMADLLAYLKQTAVTEAAAQ
jgi:putative membrane-bound dehydrogenase-like protein